MTGCRAIFGTIFSHHDLENHDESDRRLRDAVQGVPADVRRSEPCAASVDDLLRVHSASHVRMIRELSAHGGQHFIDHDTYISSRSFEVASYAAGAAIGAAEAALDGDHCFALARPPGHHAGPDRAMGYCLFNNAAIAASVALDRVDRVAIVDWDLHHGNGTQNIFYTSDRVLFCSIHQGNAFPRTGWVDEIGSGSGRGYTVNAPVRSGSTLADYRYVFERVFMPAIERFRPGIVLVSAGQDPLSDDPRSGMRLVPSDFGVLTSLLKTVTDTPLALVLEGGYGPSHGEAISMIFSALRGDFRGTGQDDRYPSESTRQIVSALRNLVL
ncbi:MAG: histone deacetylase [Methanoregula sp.]|nr:histone deacetylase [Methanoregula sp.]